MLIGPAWALARLLLELVDCGTSRMTNVRVPIGRLEVDFALGLILSDEAILFRDESLFPHMAPRLDRGALDLVRAVPRAHSAGSAGVLFRRIRAVSCDEFAPAEG